MAQNNLFPIVIYKVEKYPLSAEVKIHFSSVFFQHKKLNLQLSGILSELDLTICPPVLRFCPCIWSQNQTFSWPNNSSGQDQKCSGSVRFGFIGIFNINGSAMRYPTDLPTSTSWSIPQCF